MLHPRSQTYTTVQEAPPVDMVSHDHDGKLSPSQAMRRTVDPEFRIGEQWVDESARLRPRRRIQGLHGPIDLRLGIEYYRGAFS
jgi:hypothetical protein